MNNYIRFKYINILFYIIIILLFTGCTAISGHKNSLNDFEKKLESKQCSFKDFEKKITDNDDSILWAIQGASLARYCKDYKKSVYFFDEAESNFKKEVDKDNILNNLLESTAGILVNNNINDYEGNIYEKVMVNTYKALNFLSLNDHHNARIEFNRALDRQRRAKEYFKNEIKEKQKELLKKKSQKNSNENKIFDSLKIAKNSNTEDIIYKKYNSLLNNFNAYPDFVNPFTTYISGIYFLLNGDPSKARDLLKESVSMAPKNKQILSDFKLSDKYINSLNHSKNKYAWVIYENGKGMTKDEMKIEIPLFLFTDKAYYTGIALPKIVEKSSSYKYLNVNGQKTVRVCSMDNVIKTEFKKRFPLIVTETVLNSVVKTIVQKQLTDNSGLIGGLTGAIYQKLTNKADIRSWTALPKEFQSVRVTLDNKPLEIKDNNGNIIDTINIPTDKNALIFISSRTIGNTRIHQVLF